MQPISIWQFGPQCGPRRTRWKPPNIPSSYDVAHCHRHRCRRRIILPPCKFTDNISAASHSLTRVIYVVRNGTLASRGALICGSIRTPEPPLLNNGAPILPLSLSSRPSIDYQHCQGFSVAFRDCSCIFGIFILSPVQ